MISPYSIAHAAVASALIIALFVLWVCSLLYARRRGDPARTGFRYLHFVMAFEILALIFSVVVDALTIAIPIMSADRFSDSKLVNHLSEASGRVEMVGMLMHLIANALCIVMFAELGNGFTLARKGVREGVEKILRYLAIGAAVLMLVLGVAYFGLSNASYRRVGFPPIVDARAMNARVLLGSWYALMFVVAILLLVQAAIVVHKSRILGRAMHNSSVLYLVAVILFLVRFLYGVVVSAMYLLVNDRYYYYRPLHITSVDVIMVDLVFFIALVIVVSMGFRRRNSGLASTGGPLKQQWGYLRGQQAAYNRQPMSAMPAEQGFQYPEGPPQYYVAANQSVQGRNPEDI